jgi:hypothetical protein
MARGKTLWEMLTEKLFGPTEFKFFNPLKARVGNAVTIDEVEWRDFNFFIREIREYKRSIGEQNFFFVDYVLLARPLHGSDVVVRIRLNPVDDPDRYGGLTHHVLLLRLDDEFAYTEDFQKVLTDDTGKFQVMQDGEVKEEFFRINDVKKFYKARVAVLADLNHDKTVDRDEVKSVRLEYWDYWRELKDAAGQPVKEYLFVEKDANAGWFQLWRGQEIDGRRVIVL